MRAAAVEGVTLEKGIHRGFFGGDAITIKYPSGLRQEIPYDEDAVATPVLIDAMMEDMDIEDPETREATRQYCLDYIRGWNEIIENPDTDGGMTIAEMRNLSHGFIAGWEKAKAPLALLRWPAAEFIT